MNAAITKRWSVDVHVVTLKRNDITLSRPMSGVALTAQEKTCDHHRFVRNKTRDACGLYKSRLSSIVACEQASRLARNKDF